jgi:flagellar hook assembly protein FlgD
VKLFTALGDNTISGFELYGAYPNPFNPSTRIAFNLPNDSKVQIEIYNTLGKKIRELLNDNLNEGKHEVVWDCKDDNNNKVSSGLYYCRMMSGSFTKTIKLSLIK